MKGRDNKSTVITISSMDNLKEKIDEIGGSFPVIVYIDSSVAQIDTMTSLKSVLEAYFSIRPYENVTMSYGEEVIEKGKYMKEKDSFYKEICARYPYGLKGQVEIEVSTGDYDISSGHLEYTEVEVDVELFGIEGDDITVYPIDDKYNDVISDYNYTVDDFLPYLRPMSSMTEEEKDEYKKIAPGTVFTDGIHLPNIHQVNWLNEHHFDYNDLIGQNRALEAKEGMY